MSKIFHSTIAWHRAAKASPKFRNQISKFIIATAIGYAIVQLGAVTDAQAKTPRIGYLTLNAKPDAVEAGFEEALAKLGWIKGQKITLECRRGNRNSLAGLASDHQFENHQRDRLDDPAVDADEGESGDQVIMDFELPILD